MGHYTVSVCDWCGVKGAGNLGAGESPEFRASYPLGAGQYRSAKWSVYAGELCWEATSLLCTDCSRALHNAIASTRKERMP